MIIKHIHSQDAYYKLSPKKSGETSLNLSNEILQLIAPTLSKGSERAITFTIYRTDYLRALGAIVNCSPLYISSSTSSNVVSSDPNVFIKDFQAICSFFGPDDKKNYTVNLIYREDGRIYLNALEDQSSKFNIRHFLLEERSVLEFDKDDDYVTIRLRIDSSENVDLLEENVTELIISEKNLTSFILSVIQYVNKKNGLGAIVPYTSSSSPIQVSKRSSFKLTGMFLESTLDEVRKRNINHTRWFENQFNLGERKVFLSTQWNANGNYQLTLDDFIKMIRCCYGENYVYKKGANGEHQLFYVSKKAYNDLKDFPLQQIFYGAPGTGKSHTINEQTKGESVIRTTFHPDSDYSTFVGAYKPTTKSVELRDVSGHKIIEEGKEVKEDRIVYEFVAQAFLQAYILAWKSYSQPTDEGVVKPQYLVIEEINRGNCAQIFGDIFQLLDRDDNGFSKYEITSDADLQKYIAEQNLAVSGVCDSHGKDISDKINSGEFLKLPNNFYIWATMNTSDQSLFPIDSAFKRRWDWKYVPIDINKENWTIKTATKEYSWSLFLQKINDEIDGTTHSEDKMLGFYFCKADDGVISSEKFVGKVLFYVYNDVFKDYGFSREMFKGDDGKIISFHSYYNSDGSIDENKVEKFLDNLIQDEKSTIPSEENIEQ